MNFKKGTQIHKYDLEGDPIHTYSSMHEARIKEHVGYNRLLRAINNKQILNGHLFSFGRVYLRNALNVGIKINKVDANGVVVCTYPSISGAYRAEHISFFKLMKSVNRGVIINEHVFKIADSKHETVERNKNSEWEGSDGMFDVEAYAKVF